MYNNFIKTLFRLSLMILVLIGISTMSIAMMSDDKEERRLFNTRQYIEPKCWQCVELVSWEQSYSSRAFYMHDQYWHVCPARHTLRHRITEFFYNTFGASCWRIHTGNLCCPKTGCCPLFDSMDDLVSFSASMNNVMTRRDAYTMGRLHGVQDNPPPTCFGDM